MHAYSTIVSILYLPFGLIFVVLSVIQIVALCFTIVGIPVALVVAKSLGTALNPVNKICVRSAVVEELERRRRSPRSRSVPGREALILLGKE